MANAMTIMANGNKVRQCPVFPISVDVMNNKNPFVLYSAIIAFLFKVLPGVPSVRTGELLFSGHFIPGIKPTLIAAIGSSSGFGKNIRNNKKNRFAILASPFYFFRPRFSRTSFGAKILWFFRVFFRNKINSTIFAFIIYNRLFSVFATTFITTGNISILMACIYYKVIKTNRAIFSNLLHRSILP